MMNHPILTALILTGTLVYQAPLSAQESPSNPVLQTIVVPTGANNPSDLAAALEQIFSGDVEMMVTPLAQQSSLVIRASEPHLAQIMEVVKSITPRVHSMRVRLVLLEATSPLAANERAMLNGPIAQVAQAIEGLKRSGRALVINDIELTLVENQQARLQVGDRVAMPTGAVQMPGGREAMRFQQVEIGTQMLVKGRASEEHVVLDLEYEKSFQRAGQPDDDSGKPHDISTLTSQLTLRIPNGQAQLAGSMSDRKSDDQATTHLLIVAAENLK